ncbi:MAG: adenine deaminase [Saprospiraceae bacterium]|nr:adenine deaminase [Saprospiraceae bacterium]
MSIVQGQFVDIRNRNIFPASITIESGKIVKIEALESAPDVFLLPGFVDAHIHIESSMVTPYEFARIALGHGTVATVSDPHEIANVVGMEGVYYMIENARDVRFKFHFITPSCVPATTFENAGATIDSADIKTLMADPDIYYLSEMMNYPGVLFNDEEVMKKLAIAKASGKPIDGHAPGLMGEKAKQYADAGITTDHECFTLEEALDKIKFGMKILIREGSAAKNFNALHSLFNMHPDKLMLCSDDKHPDDLLLGHINQLVQRAVALGYDVFDVLHAACIHPATHYKLRSGTLQLGDPADFIIVEDLKDFKVLATYIDGEKVAEIGKTSFPAKQHKLLNQFNIGPKQVNDFETIAKANPQPVMQALDGELITEKLFLDLPSKDGKQLPSPENDILKIAVVNRYNEAPVATGFIKGFGLKNGAIASTVGHDSHNIIAVGTDDESLCKAVNLLIENKGGLSATNGEEEKEIALPIAGLMSDQPCAVIGKSYAEIDGFVKGMGSNLRAPFMTLSFMALLVIPKIKMSDLGLFDAEAFKFY